MLRQLEQELEFVKKIQKDTTDYKKQKLNEIHAIMCDIINNRHDNTEVWFANLKNKISILNADQKFTHKKISFSGFLHSRCQGVLNRLQNFVIQDRVFLHFDILYRYYGSNTIQARELAEVVNLIKQHNFKDAHTKFAELKKINNPGIPRPINTINYIENWILNYHYLQIDLPPNTKLHIENRKTSGKQQDLLLLNDLKTYIATHISKQHSFYFVIDIHRNIYFYHHPITSFKETLGKGEISLSLTTNFEVTNINCTNEEISDYLLNWLKTHDISIKSESTFQPLMRGL